MKNYTPKSDFPTSVKVISKQLTPYFGITAEALIQMKCYVDGCSDEIGWFFTVEKNQENNQIYIIKECYLFEQQVHATTTEIDGDRLATFAAELLEKENGFDIWNEMRGWGHSHVNMGVTPSGQDDSQMEFFARAGQPFFVRIIANKLEVLKIDLFDYTTGVAYIDVPWIEVPFEQDKEIVETIKKLQARLTQTRETKEKEYKEQIEKEIKDKVKKFTTTYGTRGLNSTENFQNMRGTGTTLTTTSAGKETKLKFCPNDEFDYQELYSIGMQKNRFDRIKMIEKITQVTNYYNASELNIILEEAERVVKLFNKEKVNNKTKVNKNEKKESTSIIKDGKIIRI